MSSKQEQVSFVTNPNAVPEAVSLAAQAKLAQEHMRKDAPGNITVGREFNDSRELLVRRLVPTAYGKSRNPKYTGTELFPGGIGATMSTCYFTPDEVRRIQVHRGWEPVLEADGSIAQDNGDWLCQRPIAISRQENKNAEAFSQERLRSMDKDTADNPLVAAYSNAERAKGREGDKTVITEFADGKIQA